MNINKFKWTLSKRKIKMKNEIYSSNMLLSNDVILIDTSSILDYEKLIQFIDAKKHILLNIGKKITVPKVVWMELMQLRNSDDFDKQSRVNLAVKIIESNSNVFTIDNQDMINEDIAPSFIDADFVDAELLSELTKNKSKHVQLLITQNKRLSSDALRLNSQGSCYDGYISVCDITNEGELNKCNIVVEAYRQTPTIKEVS